MAVPLTFQVKAGTYRRDDPHAGVADADFRGVRLRCLKRDHFVCQACGLPSWPNEGAPSGGFEVHHLNGDHADNRPENLVTLCPLCHGIFHMGLTVRRRPGKFIWLPGVSQAALNLLVHVMAIARLRGNLPGATAGARHMARVVSPLWRRLSQKRLPAGCFMDPEGGDTVRLLETDPASFGAALARLQERPGYDPGRLQRSFGGLRWLYGISSDTEAGVYADCRAWFGPRGWEEDWMNCLTQYGGRYARQ